jgi:hypothetical protein
VYFSLALDHAFLFFTGIVLLLQPKIRPRKACAAAAASMNKYKLTLDDDTDEHIFGMQDNNN